MLIAQIILVNFPFHLYKFVQANPLILPNSISIEIFIGNQNHMRMVPSQCDKGSLFVKLTHEFKKIFKVSSPGKVIKSVLWGDNLLIIMSDLLATLQREERVEKVVEAPSAPEPEASNPGTGGLEPAQASS